jgi:TetR/AcrR family transcriptional repressor of nem operon
MAKAEPSEPTEMSHKERTRARILDEAAKALRAEGIGGIGVADLMKRAGLTHGGFYAHFASRDDLVAHAIDRMFVDSNFYRNRPLDADDPREGLTRFIDGYLSETARRNPDHSCPIPSLVSEIRNLPMAARERFTDGYGVLRTAMAAALKKAGHKDANALAGSVLAEMVGAMAIARALPDDGEAAARLASARDTLKRRLGLAKSSHKG